MIDFIKATKSLYGKDMPFLKDCTLEARYSSGWEKYYLHGCNDIEIWWNPHYKRITLKGSIMYFYQGHNVIFKKREFVDAIDYIRKVTKINWWNADIEEFEYGIILEVPDHPKEYIAKHCALSKEKLLTNEKARDKGNFKWWNDGNVSIKMYDEGKNIKNKLNKAIQDAIQKAGWNLSKQYLKFECHYFKPEILNHGKSLKLAYLIIPNWEKIFKQDLLKQYKRLEPIQSVIIPTDKKKLSTPDILVIEICQTAINNNQSIDVVKKRIYKLVNTLSINKCDKDARKRQVRNIFNKLKVESISKWDVSQTIREALDSYNNIQNKSEMTESYKR